MNTLKYVLCLLLLAAADALYAQTYKPVDNESSVKFTIKNFGFGVDGSFKNLTGVIVFDPNNVGNAVFNVTVDAATINTGNKSRDGHLKKSEYFDVAKFPAIAFVSSKIEKTAGGYLATGTFTIKNKSKVVQIPFTVTAQNTVLLLNGKVQLNRRDFGVGGSSMVLSDIVNLSLSVKAKQ